MNLELNREKFLKLDCAGIVLKHKDYMIDSMKIIFHGGVAHIDKTTVDQALLEATSEQKEILEDVFEIDVLEDNTWYFIDISAYRTALIFNKDSELSYGWGFIGEFTSEFGLNVAKRDFGDSFKKATEKEVLDRFKKELSERGFVNGCEFIGYDGDAYKYDDNIFFHADFPDIVIGGGCGMVFEDGEFSKLLSEKEPDSKRSLTNTVTQEELPLEMYVWGDCWDEYKDAVKRTVIAIDNGKYIYRGENYENHYYSIDNCKYIK